MTREEAIKILRKEIECLSHTTCSDCPLEKVCDPIRTTPFDSEYIEVYEMAIKALEQEPCDDAISRQAVYEQINCWIGSGEYRYTNATHYLTKRIQELQPVTSQPKTDTWSIKEVADALEKHGLRMSEISETEIKSMTKEQNYMRGYENGKSDVLDKIKAEIKEESRFCPLTEGLERALEIIDKYTAEKEWLPQYEGKWVAESDIEKRKECSHKPCINHENGCEEWAGCPCVYYKAESEDKE